MSRHEGSALVVLIAIVLAVVAVLYRRDADERQECVTTGGRVVEVHTYRGGWFCDRD